MFADQPINFTLTAAGAISRYHLVQGSGSNTGGLATAVTQALVGVAQNDPAAAGEAVTVCPLGKSRVYAGGTIAVGDRLTTNASGRAVACTSGSVYFGYALEGAAAGDLFTAMVNASLDKMLT